jgi:hypothetical protein
MINLVKNKNYANFNEKLSVVLYAINDLNIESLSILIEVWYYNKISAIHPSIIAEFLSDNIEKFI